ncbi:uncharacterized protein [Watersipora subatra]|uniref:uncharacterized protein n=1 Tax=Watersipora subatra TaxID=2589382 RepID=UPI00355BC53A
MTLELGVFFYLLSLPLSIQQTVHPYILCKNSSVTVRAGASGIIEHVQEDRDTPCTLSLSGFDSRGYLSLHGLDVRQEGCESLALVEVNHVTYCVRGSSSGFQFITQLTNGRLYVTLSSASSTSFRIAYYSNVAICGGTFTITEGAEASQLSGVISSSYNLSSQPSLQDCRVRIKLPNPNITVRFELLLLTSSLVIQVRDKQFSSGARDPITVKTGSERSLSLSCSNDGTSVLFGRFMIRVTVLHCGDMPEKSEPYHSISLPPTPWLPHTKAMYGCADGWMTANSSFDYVECLVNSGKTKWSDYPNITCNKVMCEVTEKQLNIPNGNSTYRKYSYKEELVYYCNEDYKRYGSVACNGDGSWSAEPKCISTHSNGSSFILYIGLGLGLLMFGCSVAAVICLVKHRRRTASENRVSKLVKTEAEETVSLDSGEVRKAESIQVSYDMSPHNSTSSPEITESNQPVTISLIENSLYEGAANLPPVEMMVNSLYDSG